MMTDFQNHNDNIMQLKLTIGQKEYAAKVLNESDENRDNAIAEIKHWIEESDVCARTDDFFILRFLRTCKFNIEDTKIKIRNYQKQRVDLPEWYANRDPLQPRLQELLNLGICFPLRKLDDQGRMVFIVRLVHDPNIFKLSEVIKVICMIVDIALRDSVEASLYGIVIISDMGHLSLSHVAQITPSAIMNVCHMWQDFYPMRIQLINYINTPEYAKLILVFTRMFLNSKLKEKFHVYSRKSDDCFKDVQTDILPVDYGGSDGTIQEAIEYWKRKIEKNRQWFIDDEKYKPILEQ